MIEASPGCSFCIRNRDAASTPVVYQSPEVVAFFPLHPAALGHTLVVPRKHIADIWELGPVDAQPLTAALLGVARAIQQALCPDGLNVISSAGAAASQTVFHLHFHLVPRWHDDDFGSLWPEPGPAFSHEELVGTARSIRTALADGPAASEA